MLNAPTFGYDSITFSLLPFRLPHILKMRLVSSCLQLETSLQCLKWVKNLAFRNEMEWLHIKTEIELKDVFTCDDEVCVCVYVYVSVSALLVYDIKWWDIRSIKHFTNPLCDVVYAILLTLYSDEGVCEK